MTVIGGTLARYFGMQCLRSMLTVFGGMIVLIAVVDYVEMMRRLSDIPQATALLVFKTSIFRVPQVAERLLPFCVLIGAMWAFLNLSRRLEFVIARSAGMSAWQFIMPGVIVAFVIGVIGTTIYNPISASLQETSRKLEDDLFRHASTETSTAYWGRQRTDEGLSIINAKSSRDQGAELSGVTIFTFDLQGQFRERIEAATATLGDGTWRLTNAKTFPLNGLPTENASLALRTSLTREQVRESFSTPETVPFWELPQYIKVAELSDLAAASYRLQFQKLLAQPFLLASMVLLAAAVSLRFFRFGGVQNMILGGVVAGFLLYVLSKVTDDMSTAELLSPFGAAWLQVTYGGLIGVVVLLYQEDG
ncbi:MAG: LPS export ABC transporter permease LptG [Pseudolabrys sp.]|nr:LPS export ABC transporter permease LptG [Pseudolabrys sp.]